MTVLPKNTLKYIAGLTTALIVNAGLLAAEPISKSILSGIAIGGHDTVAYHSLTRAPQQTAAEGADQFSVDYKGAVWRFTSKDNADLFRSEPENYSPAYNGFCANALSLGEGLIKTDGATWEIFENKLYLYYAPRGRERWLAGEWKDYKQQADEAWAKLSK